MKKVLLLLSTLLLSLGLVACSDKKNETPKPTKPKTESVKPKEEVADDTVYTKTLTYERGTTVKQQGRETITYKGKEILSLDVQLVQPFDDNTKANLSQYDLQTVKPDVIASLEKDPTLSQLLGKSGLTTSFDISDAYDLIINMHIDMATVNIEELKKIENFSYDFAGLENTTPRRYIAALTIRGAEEVNP